MLGIIAVSISILVVLAGLAMLAKSKKEELGKLYTFSSYAAIICGVGLFIGTNVNGLRRASCGSHGSCASYASQCGQSSCASASSCSYSGHGMASCKRGGHASCNSGHGKACGHASCGSGHGMGHAGNGHGSCSHGAKKHKIIKEYHHSSGDDDDKHIEINVEIEEGDEDDEKNEE